MATLHSYNKYYPMVYDYAASLPEGWQLLPNIAIFQERIERGNFNEELLSVTIGKGVIKQADIDIKKDSSNEDKSKYKLIKVGDIAYNKMRMWQGALGYSNYHGISSPAYVILKPKMKINPRYFHYMFRTSFYTNYSKRFSYGIVDDQLSLRYTDFKRMYSIVPPLEVQNSIVSYLDKKNNEIDKFIRNKEKLIELLEGQRKEIITKSIFNGNYQFKPLKYFVSKVGSGVTPLGGANVYTSEGIAFLRSQNIHFNGLRLDDVAFISEKDHSKMKATKVRQNDVLLNITGASIGRCCTIEEEIEANVNQHVCIIRPKEKLNPKYLSYYLASTTIQNLIRSNQDGASREGLSLSEIKRFLIPIVSLEKQMEIVKSIKEAEIGIDIVISKAQKEMAFIKEYREALITDLVTGKRSVPQIQ